MESENGKNDDLAGIVKIWNMIRKHPLWSILLGMCAITILAVTVVAVNVIIFSIGDVTIIVDTSETSANDLVDKEPNYSFYDNLISWLAPNAKSNFDYSLHNDGIHIIKYNGNGKGRNIKIPKKFNGDSVTVIKDSAFEHNKYLTSLTIPESVITIGKRAFADCTKLKKITLPNGITSVSEGMFSGCESLTKIIIPNTVTLIYNSAFSGSALKSVKIPESVVTIGKQAFADCTKLKTIIIPDSVIDIDETAFDGCKKLKVICSRDSYAYKYCIEKNIKVEEKIEINLKRR